jgi:ketosteroid isomerase-like protein
MFTWGGLAARDAFIFSEKCMKTRSHLVVGLTLAALVGCGPSPLELAQNFDNAMGAKNIDAAAALLAEGATMTMDGKTITGAAAIKAQLATMAGQSRQLEANPQYKVDADKVSAVQKVTTDDLTKLGVDSIELAHELRVAKGHIAQVSWTTTPESTAKVQAAIAAATKKVVDDFNAAVNAKNVEAALALMTDDASYTVATDKVLNGKDQIKAYLENMAQRNLAAVAGERTVAGNKVTWTVKLTSDEWPKDKIVSLDANCEATVLAGKIKSMSMLLSADSAAKLQELAAAAAAPKKGGKGKK